MINKYGICTLAQKMASFCQPESLICFRIRVRVMFWARISRNTYLVKHVFEQV